MPSLRGCRCRAAAHGPRALLIVAALMATACTTVTPGQAGPSAPVAASASCTATEREAALRRFVEAWNARRPDLLAGVLSDSTLLSMSARDQRARPPVLGGGYSSFEGPAAILRFAGEQWGLGETLGYRGARPFDGGVYADGMAATFDDGTSQQLDGKFGYDCAARSFSRVVLTAYEVAGR